MTPARRRLPGWPRAKRRTLASPAGPSIIPNVRCRLSLPHDPPAFRRVEGLAVRLYLSSFRMGDHPEHLVALIGQHSRRAVVIANAVDDAPPDVRRAGAELELAALAALGFDAVELDLRGYFTHQQRLRRDLAGAGMAWLRGGNVFMLRYALYRSGADTVFRELLAADSLVYAGYSAGPCVLSPSLRGLELVDDADAVTRIYGA